MRKPGNNCLPCFFAKARVLVLCLTLLLVMGYVAFVFPSFNHSCSTLFFCVSQEESHTPGCFSLMKTLDYSVVPGQQFRCKEVALS